MSIRVQRGSINLGVSAATNTAPISAVSGIGKALELSSSNTGMGGSVPNNITTPIYNQDYFSSIQLLNATTVQANRAIAGSPAHVLYHPFEIVEYTGPANGENDFTVRQRNIVRQQGTATALCPDIITTIGTMLDCAVVHSGGENEDQFRSHDNHVGTLALRASGANWVVELQRSSSDGSYAPNENTRFVVPEFHGSAWTVQRVTHNYSTVGTQETETIASVGAINRAFIIDTFRTISTKSGAITGLAYMVNPTTVGFRLSPSNDVPTSCAHIVYVVSNPNITARHYSGTIPGTMTNSSPLNIPITEVAAMNTTFSRFTTIIDQGGVTPANPPLNIISGELTSPTNYRLRRSYVASPGNSAGEYRLTIVELPTTTVTYRDIGAAFVSSAAMSGAITLNLKYLVANFIATASMTAVGIATKRLAANFEATSIMDASITNAHKKIQAHAVCKSIMTAQLSNVILLAANFVTSAFMVAGRSIYKGVEASFVATSQIAAAASRIQHRQASIDGVATLTARGVNPGQTPFAHVIETVITKYQRETTVH